MSSILLRTVPPRHDGVPGGDATRPTPLAPPPLRRSPIEVTLEVIGDRWKALVVWHLFWGARPFCELMRQTSGITKKNLRRVLGEMEGLGIVWKEVRPGPDRKAEYTLTPLGQSLKPVIGAMYEWGLSLVTPPRAAHRSQ